MTRRRERGFTLIELMVALVVSSLLVGMILAIFNRMSLAYRGQQQIAGVQQVLAAARATLELDAKQAGYLVPQGFTVASQQNVLQSPVQIINNRNNKGPDQVAFFYADSSAQLQVSTAPNWTNDPTITATSANHGFVPNDLVLIVTNLDPAAAISSGTIAKYDACVVKIRTVSGTQIKFTTAPPWGLNNEPQCGVGWSPSSTTMMYRFVAHAYRIDTSTAARAALGPLQQSLTGGLFNNDVTDGWADIAYGFTDLQTAIQAYDHNYDLNDTPDPDADGDRDWYSGDLQTTLTATAFNNLSSPLVPPGDTLLQMSISLVARTDRDIEGIETSTTPSLTVAGNANNNLIGDRAAIALPSADPALTGSRIYRYTSFRVDFRNMGLGR